jgi:hypothetical protein
MKCRGASEARTEPYLNTVREYWSWQRSKMRQDKKLDDFYDLVGSRLFAKFDFYGVVFAFAHKCMADW